MLHMTSRVVRIVIGTLEDIYGRRKICNGRVKDEGTGGGGYRVYYPNMHNLVNTIIEKRLLNL